MSGTTDIDRALASVRSKADHLRHTIHRLEHNLAWNPTMTWPEYLSQFTVISKQLENMNDDIPEMLQHFVCIPKSLDGQNPNEVPQLLRTRDDQEMEELDDQMLRQANDSQQKEWETLRKAIDKQNEANENLEDWYKMKSDEVLKQMKMHKCVTPSPAAPILNSKYQFMETGL